MEEDEDKLNSTGALIRDEGSFLKTPRSASLSGASAIVQGKVIILMNVN